MQKLLKVAQRIATRVDRLLQRLSGDDKIVQWIFRVTAIVLAIAAAWFLRGPVLQIGGYVLLAVLWLLAAIVILLALAGAFMAGRFVAKQRRQPAGHPVTSSERVKVEKPPMQRGNVAGVTHEGRQRILQRIPTPTKAAMLRERDNPHDPNAIAIYVTGKKIGYVPADIAEQMALVMDAEDPDWMYHIPWLKVGTWEPEPGRTLWSAEFSAEPRRPDPAYECREHLP